MEPLSRFAAAWLPLFGLHMLEISLFVFGVWLVDRLIRLPTPLRYSLWMLALVKVFIPPVLSLPVPVLTPPRILLQPLAGEAGEVSGQEIGSLTLAVVLLGVWIGSILLLAASVVYQNYALRRRLRRGNRLNLTWEGLAGQPLPVGLRVFTLDTLEAPVLLGFRYPQLYLPGTWSTWSPTQQRGILAHELAHLHYRDLWVLVLQTLALILFGLNPLVWLLHSRLSQVRELRCDEAAIADTGISPVDYSKLLYAFIEKQTRRLLPVATGSYFSENNETLFRRLHHLLSLKEAAMKSRTRWHYALFALLGLAILPLSLRCSDQAKILSVAPETASEKAALTKASIPLPSEEVYFQPYDTPPSLVKMVRPEYPESARKAGIEGVVVMQILVDEEGKVIDAKVMRGLGDNGLEKAAIEAAYQTKFTPALSQGEPTKVWIAYPVKFKLSR